MAVDANVKYLYKWMLNPGGTAETIKHPGYYHYEVYEVRLFYLGVYVDSIWLWGLRGIK